MKIKQLFTLFLFLSVSLTVFASPVKALPDIVLIAENGETDSDFDDDFSSGEFDDEFSFDDSTESDESSEQYPINLIGFLRLASSYNTKHDRPAPDKTDWRGLSSLMTELFMELDVRFSPSWKMKVSGSGFYDSAYSLNGRSDYTDDVLNNYEHDVELEKAYIEGSITKKIDIKEGRQLVVWGTSDSIRVTDILNPVNHREPGKTDIEDLRLPLWMTKLSFYTERWSLAGIAVHERRWNKLPEYGSDFYTASIAMPPEVSPSENVDNTEYAISLKGMFTGWDISFYYADYYEDIPVLKYNPARAGLFELRHAHQYMYGADFTAASGDFVFKAEAAHFNGIRFSDNVILSVFPPVLNTVTEKYRKTNALLGIEYSGFNDTMITVETMNSHINDFDLKAEKAGVIENNLVTAIRIQRDFMNERLTFELLSLIYGEKSEDGGIHRLISEFDITDNLIVKAGYMLYESGDLPEFTMIGENDRAFLEVKYNF